jgi:hypothetical protein
MRLARIDGRTRESQLVREERADLLAHVGDNPSVVQLALIERLIQLKLRISVMDRKWHETGEQTDLDGRQYLAWTNTYGKLLGQLGIKTPSLQLLKPITTPTLAEHIAARGRQASSEAQDSPAAPADEVVLQWPRRSHSEAAD